MTKLIMLLPSPDNDVYKSAFLVFLWYSTMALPRFLTSPFVVKLTMNICVVWALGRYYPNKIWICI